MNETATLPPDAEVMHATHGRGTVVVDRGQTIIVRFPHGLEELPPSSLRTTAIAADAGEAAPPLPGLLRLQAECIRSVNDAWGVFSRSRIDLLPHQMWVCRKVNASWPTRWLVADDVGLGKTIEAGLILWPLLSRGVVRRLLILCPASLVEQWQYRLRTMFDIRCAVYSGEQDTPRSDYWGTHPVVVASLETLRLEKPERRGRMMEADPWDLLIVDEAHRLNADEEQGPTLGYKLVEQLRDAGKFASMIFFTGTPHRGKNYGFLSLLALLRPEDFDPREPFEAQLRGLRSAMIRNNKQDVTDLEGNRLFHPPIVESATYAYSPAEAEFYDMLTDFIASGKAYANGLAGADGRAVILVLISMQKLASSSVAAISSALRKRLAGIETRRNTLGDLKRRRDGGSGLAVSSFTREYREQEGESDFDRLAALDERIGDLEETLALTEDEEPRLRELIAAAAAVEQETKIERIVRELADGGRYEGRSVLLFTEYKATQALLVSRLFATFGDSCCAFINGDDRLDGVAGQDGRPRSLRSRRVEAADAFNAGEVRFLVATEAGGEGIDLQRRCHTLIHVDLPWNPMRLHQRVGRLNRYGQTTPVEVLTLRNPDTVESRIWDHLNAKLERIQKAFTGAMDEPEDILQLVLGMASPTLFRELFTDAPRDEAKLATWFDGRTAKLGGRDVVEAVKEMVGHAARFNFGTAGARLPKVDLPDLRPFLVGMLTQQRRKVRVSDDGPISFLTPDEWRNEPGITAEYADLTFDRRGKSNAVAGVGQRLFDRAVRAADEFEAGDIALPRESLERRLHVFRVADRVTGTAGEPPVVAAVEVDDSGEMKLVPDWQVLLQLNEFVLPSGRSIPPASVMRPADGEANASSPAGEAQAAERFLLDRLDEVGAAHAVPEVRVLGSLCHGG